jgi:hypothetical protein
MRAPTLATVAALLVVGCGDPSLTEPAGPQPPSTAQAPGFRHTLPKGYIELWAGGPIVPDTPAMRSLQTRYSRGPGSLAASLSARRTSLSVVRPELRLVQTTGAEFLESGDPSAADVYPAAINGSGLAVGSTCCVSAARWLAGSTIPVTIPIPFGWNGIYVIRVNDAGQMGGAGATPAGVRAVRWAADGTPTILPPLAGNESRGYAFQDLAENGDVLGFFRDPVLGLRFVLWQGTTPTEVYPPSPGSYVTALNSGGYLLGLAGGSYLRDPSGNWQALAAPDGFDVNVPWMLADDGQVYGAAFNSGSGAAAPIVWSTAGVPTALPLPPGATDAYAMGVNADGSMLVSAFDAVTFSFVPYVLDGGAFSLLPLPTPSVVGDWTFNIVRFRGNYLLGYWWNSAPGATVREVALRTSFSFASAPTFSFTGFFPPVLNPPAVNSVEAGRAVPVKFSLGGDQGLDIFQVESPSSISCVCPAGPTNLVEPTTTASTSGLQYDPISQTYIYVWKTERAWAQSCRQLTLGFKYGTTRTALFSFR